MVGRPCGASYSFLAAVAGPDQAGQQPATGMRRWPHAAGITRVPLAITLAWVPILRQRLVSCWNAWQSVPSGNQQENVMRQRKHKQDQQADSAGSPALPALQAVQVSLDRRDNGGDAHPVSSE